MKKSILLLVLILTLPLASPLRAKTDASDANVNANANANDEPLSTVKSDPSANTEKKEAVAPVKKDDSAVSTHGTDSNDQEWKTMTSEKKPTRKVPASASSVKIDEANKIVHTEKITFAFNSNEPTVASARTLKQLAKLLIKKPGLSLRIEGHTDSVGSDQSNLEKSQQRADTVKEILVKEGVAPERLESVGMGDKVSLASDATYSGQEKNRRVEFHIINPAPEAPVEQPVLQPPAQPASLPETVPTLALPSPPPALPTIPAPSMPRPAPSPAETRPSPISPGITPPLTAGPTSKPATPETLPAVTMPPPPPVLLPPPPVINAIPALPTSPSPTTQPTMP